jgi:hypothetical protein
VKINSVLEEYSISEERYQEYMSLLDLLGAQRVSYGNSEDPWVSVLMQATGLSVSGCSTTLERIKSGKIPETEQSAGYSTEVMEIKDGWYLRKHCT